MIVVMMGVVGSGKTTVGRLLAEQLGWQFADADDYHSAASIEKIRHGIPLNDKDRRPWLLHLRALIATWISQRQIAVLACSALKRSYRDELRIGPEVRFVYLQGSAELIARRLHARHGHFADDQILASQLADLEEPESALTVDIAQSPKRIVAEIVQKLGLS
ncbi:MAG: gluconokinase [Candidatus Sulfotelmatobacter sp.]